MRPLSILMFPQKQYPSDHAMLEEVYTKILPARGHRVTFVMRPRQAGRDQRPVEWNGATVHLLPSAAGHLPAGRARRLAAPLTDRVTSLRIARELKPDVVQVRNEIAGALVAAHLQFWHRIPFVYQISFPVIEGTATAARLGLARFPRAQAIRSAGLVRLQRRLMRGARLVLPISDVMRADLASVGVPEDRMLTFPLGADTSFDPAAIDPTPARRRMGLRDEPVVLYFGALDRLRGLEFLLDAFGRVHASRPDARLVFLGRAANQADVDDLRQRAGRAGLAQAVIFAGGVRRAEVPAYLAAAALAVSPYPPLDIYRSVSPTKLMEAMAMARPVVGNDVSEQGAILREGGGGLVATYEPGAFADAILALLTHPGRATDMGRRGREWVVANRSFEALADRIESAYERLIGAPQPG
jgi:glycosyltransferase involved in cell wall biosynthesis